MKIKFRKMMRDVENKFDCLKTSPQISLEKIKVELPKRGVYLISEGKSALYVGRSNNIKSRLRGHLGNSHYSATFAFLLAREDAGCLKASYKKEHSRSHLLTIPKFRRCFDSARRRLKKMKVRVVEEINPTKQAVLEIYAAFVTRAKYCNFDNH